MKSFAIKFDDSLNAILVKELRQTVRGKFLWSTFYLFLAIMVIIIGLSLAEGKNNNGDDVMNFLFAILYFACFFLVPLYVGKKVNTEKNDGMNELLSITTMTPKSIVLGKLLCGLIIITMLYCAFMPFMSLTLFMGGVDVHEMIIATILSFSFCILATLFQIGIGLEALGVAALGVAVKIIGVVIQISLFSASISLCMEALRGKVVESYWALLGYLVAEAVVGLIIFATSVSFLQPDTSNKSYSMRKYLTVLWFIGIGLMFIKPTSLEEIIVVLALVILYVSGSYLREPEYYSERVVKLIPGNPTDRFLKFPLYTGMANGFVWVALITVLSAIAASAVRYFSGGTITPIMRSRDNFVGVFFTIIATFNAYGLFANFIRKTFWKNFSRSATIIIAIIIYLVIGWLPLILINVFWRYNAFDSRTIMTWVNPVFGLMEGEIGTAMVVSFLLLGLALVFNSRALLRQIKDYYSMTAYGDEEERQ